MNKDEIPQLARELISRVANKSSEKLSLIFTEEGGAPVLVATAGDSVLRFNPQQWTERIIAKNALVAEIPNDEDTSNEESKDDADVQNDWVIRQSEEDLIRLLSTVNIWLGEGLWVLSRLAPVSVIDSQLGPFFQKVQVHIKLSALRDIEGRLRELLHLPQKDVKLAVAEMEQLKGGDYDYAITDVEMVETLMKLERFSIKGLARLLAPDRDDFRSSVYDWMRRKGIGRAELEKWWLKLHGV